MAQPAPATRQALLDAAERLMLAHGVGATTVDQICDAASVTKGACFHYFASKDALAQATLERFCRRSGERYQAAPFNAKRDPLARLHGYIDFTIAQVTDPFRDGCLVGVFSQELAESHPPFRRQCDQAFTGWAAELTTMLDAVKRHYAPRARIDTRSLAEHFLAVFEGALILAKARHDVAPVKAQLRHFQRYVDSLFPRTHP